jgi:hypothetical protein
MARSHTTSRTRARSREYDPDTETDPLIRKYITLPPPFSGRNDPVVVGTAGDRFSVWSVYLNYLITHGDIPRMLAESYGDELTPEHIEAARRFAEFYPDEIMPYIEPHLNDT